MTCWLCGFETTELVTNARILCNNGPCRVCIAVAKLDEEINQATATLRRLIAKRYDLYSEHNEAHDPMHRLPVEVRNYTFELLLPTQDKWGRIAGDAGPTRVLRPSYLTLICRHWRDIALANPFLWSTIRIVLGKYRASKIVLSDCLNFVHDWILRSQAMPITLHISAYKASEEEWGRTLDVIGPSSSRWHSLSLDVPHEQSSSSYRNLISAFHHNDLQYDSLRRLQVKWASTYRLPLLNPAMSPEEIDIRGLLFRSLEISWNRLTSAKVEYFALEEIVQLFRHASRMTHCHILEINPHARLTMPLIIQHRRLESLELLYVADNMATRLFDSLTLPRLKEFHTNDMNFLKPDYLPALVARSSCPLTSIRLSDPYIIPDFQPLPGVTHLVLETVVDEPIKELVLEDEYFPDLRHLTLRLRPFLFLWKNGIIRMMLDRKGPQPDALEECRLHKIVVVDEDNVAEMDEMWNTDVGKELNQLDIILRKDGFEFL